MRKKVTKPATDDRRRALERSVMFATVSGSFAVHACRAEATQLARHVAAPRRAVERVPVLVAVDGSL
jgi:hypothetical protein